MKKDTHRWAVTLAEMKVYHQEMLTERLEQSADEKMIRDLRANS